MVVTDPQGKRSGYNPFTQESFSEIPGGTYFAAESISDPDDASTFTPPEVRFEGMKPVSGQYQVQIFAKSNTRYELTRYSFDSTGTINGLSTKKGALPSRASTVIPLKHSDNAIRTRPASININKVIYANTRYKDMAFISGRIIPADGHSIFSISRYVQIKIAALNKKIDSGDFRKIKTQGQTIYVYGGFGKNNLFLKLNVNTGDFDMFIGKAHLDNRNESITTNIMIQVDDVIAKSLVTFKNIRKNNIYGR